MDKSTFPISQSEVNIFHSTDRMLYTVLVLSLARDPIESMHVMAFWLWLEQIGHKNVVRKQLRLPFSTITDLADEAVTCIKWIINCGDQLASTSQSDIPTIKRLVGNQISLQFLHRNRFVAINSLNKILSEMCEIALGDIMHDLIISRNAAQIFAYDQSTMPGFRQPLVYSEPLPMDRTLFITFSKGYYVHEYMVWDLFTKKYGPCIESMQMEKVEYGQQPLYAFVIFHAEETVKRILNGSDKVRYVIHGKQIWARKFEPIPPRTSGRQLR